MDRQSAINFIKNGSPFECTKDSENLTNEFKAVATEYFRLGVLQSARYLLTLPENERAYILGYVNAMIDSVGNKD